MNPINKTTDNKLRELVTPEDFKEGSLLRIVAEKNVKLALDCLDVFQGMHEYIPSKSGIYRTAFRRYASQEKNKLKKMRHIAMDLGLTMRQMRRIRKQTTELDNQCPLDEPPA